MIRATYLHTDTLAALPTMVKPEQSNTNHKRGSSLFSSNMRSKKGERPLSPRTKAIIREAENIDSLLMQLSCIPDADTTAQFELIEQHEKVKHLNSFGKQLLIRMFRSNDRFGAYKIDLEQFILKSDVLFLVGTLCDSFDYMNTSPIFGLNILDIGCGALSTYGVPDEQQDLLTQFYADRPPLATEMLQMLGAKTLGLDPRENHPEEYRYHAAYKHCKVEFEDIAEWLQMTQHKFDVISCMNLFNRHSFLYDHCSGDDVTTFFQSLLDGLVPDGLFYTSPPLIPSSEEQRNSNRLIFRRAGFRILHEGYFFILARA